MIIIIIIYNVDFMYPIHISLSFNLSVWRLIFYQRFLGISSVALQKFLLTVHYYSVFLDLSVANLLSI